MMNTSTSFKSMVNEGYFIADRGMEWDFWTSPMDIISLKHWLIGSTVVANGERD